MSLISSNTSYKIFSLAAGMLAGAATTAIAKSIWSSFRNDPPPADPEDPDTRWKDALLWTMATGLTAGITRMLIMRGANQGWRAIAQNIRQEA